MSEMLFCVNTNSFHHRDAFNGQTYDFPPGEKVMVSLEAAQHMFAVGLPDKSPVFHRNGWAFKYNPETKGFDEDKDAVQRLKNFHFTKAKIVESPAEAG